MPCQSKNDLLQQLDIKNNIRIKDFGGLRNKLTGMVLFPLGLNDVEYTRNKSFILKFEQGFGSLLPTKKDSSCCMFIVQLILLPYDINDLK